MTQDSGPVVATGKIIHCGKPMAASEATLVDREGKLCAHATAMCTIFR
jgi:acyl-coenzyme A thioesterase PaaI-like protein